MQLPRVYDAWHTPKPSRRTTRRSAPRPQVLAGGKASRLYKRLVYELQIASNVYAYQDGRRMDGEFRVVATARPGHGLDELQQVIDEEVARAGRGRPDRRASWSGS